MMEGAGNPVAVHVKTAESVALVTYSVSLEKIVGGTIETSERREQVYPSLGQGWHRSLVALAPKLPLFLPLRQTVSCMMCCMHILDGIGVLPLSLAAEGGSKGEKQCTKQSA